MNKKLIFIICLIIYLIAAFVTEIFYRNKLYKKSIEYIEKIKQNGFFHYFYFFWSMIFLYGMMAVGILLTFIFYPINIFYCHLSVEIFFIFIMCILKSLYSNSRPYWDIYSSRQGNETIKFLPKPTECDGEFGNPSGHSMLSTYILILWDLFLKSKFFENLERKRQLITKYITLIISLVFIAFVTYSRINRQIHSFNQIIFGAILGFSICFTFCHILELNKIETKIFMENIHNYKFIIIPIFIILFIISVILGLFRHNKNEDKYEFILKMYCNFAKGEMFGKNTAYTSSLVFILIGGFIGLLFLRNKIIKNHPEKENKFYDWNKGKKVNTLKIALFTLILSAIILIPVLFIKHYIAKFIVSSFLFFFFGFCLFGLILYYACKIFKKNEIEVEIKIFINNGNNENIVGDI